MCDILDIISSLISSLSPSAKSHTPALHFAVYSTTIHTNVHMVAEQCVGGTYELQKLGRPPIYSGKEDEWNEWSFVMRSHVSFLSVHIAALLTGAEHPTIPDMSMSRIKTTLTNGIEAVTSW